MIDLSEILKGCFTVLFGLGLFYCLSCQIVMGPEQQRGSDFLTYVVNPTQVELQFYWQNAKGENYKSLQRLKNSLEADEKTLLFAMNGGMYLKDGSPQGLYVESGEVLKEVDRRQQGYGNFYLQPNGIFYLTTDQKARISTTAQFVLDASVQYATQSGPMLVVDGKIHAAFKPKSRHLHIRNGVGILPDGNILFAMSKSKVCLYDFAQFFQSKGCQTALYLDGFVSRAYVPEKDWVQLDGQFGVIIGVTKK